MKISFVGYKYVGNIYLKLIVFLSKRIISSMNNINHNIIMYLMNIKKFRNLKLNKDFCLVLGFWRFLNYWFELLVPRKSTPELIN